MCEVVVVLSLSLSLKEVCTLIIPISFSLPWSCVYILQLTPLPFPSPSRYPMYFHGAPFIYPPLVAPQAAAMLSLNRLPAATQFPGAGEGHFLFN